MKTLPFGRWRRMPVVFRIAIAVLVVAACFGGWWRGQPAGGGTNFMMRGLVRVCPAVIGRAPATIVADGARAGDRVAWALIADRLLPQPRSRCAGKKAMGRSEKANS